MIALTIIIPAYNEEKTIEQVLNAVLELNLQEGAIEVIVVNDGSQDKTGDMIEKYRGKLAYIIHQTNGGKGSAIRAGLELASGEYTLIQDADLEYSPKEIPFLLKRAKEKNARVVFGSRNLYGKHPHSSYIGGLFVTWVTNMLYGTHLTDEATGYKLIQTNLFKELHIQSHGFELCPEITAKIAKQGIQIEEVPITYHPRTRADGKKIRARDGLIAIKTLLYYKFFSK